MACRVAQFTSKIPTEVGARELELIGSALSIPEDKRALVFCDVVSSGNALIVKVYTNNCCLVFSSIGERGRPAGKVVADLAQEVRGFLDSGATVNEYLQDQILLPLVLRGGGEVRTGPLSSHTKTNIDVIKRFVDCKIETRQLGSSEFLIEIRRK